MHAVFAPLQLQPMSPTAFADSEILSPGVGRPSIGSAGAFAPQTAGSRVGADGASQAVGEHDRLAGGSAAPDVQAEAGSSEPHSVVPIMLLL